MFIEYCIWSFIPASLADCKILSTELICDIICLLLVFMHVRHMELNGYWLNKYLIKKSFSETLIENYRRILANSLEPESYNETHCIVRVLNDVEESNDKKYSQEESLHRIPSLRV